MERADFRRCRCRRPVRRAQPHNAAPLLIDQHGRVAPPDRVPQVGREVPDIVCVTEVPCEQDEAQRVGVAQERAFIACQRGP